MWCVRCSYSAAGQPTCVQIFEYATMSWTVQFMTVGCLSSPGRNLMMIVADLATSSRLSDVPSGTTVKTVRTPGPVSTSTQTFQKEVEQPRLDSGTCSDDPGYLSGTYTGVAHITAFADGAIQLAVVTTGEVTYVPLDPTKPTLTGHETFRFTIVMQGGVADLTHTITAQGSDGSIYRITIVEHYTVNPDGSLTTVFEQGCD